MRGSYSHCCYTYRGSPSMLVKRANAAIKLPAERSETISRWTALVAKHMNRLIHNFMTLSNLTLKAFTRNGPSRSTPVFSKVYVSFSRSSDRLDYPSSIDWPVDSILSKWRTLWSLFWCVLSVLERRTFLEFFFPTAWDRRALFLRELCKSLVEANEFFSGGWDALFPLQSLIFRIILPRKEDRLRRWKALASWSSSFEATSENSEPCCFQF